MTSKAGDTVFVSERNDLTGDVTVSPATVIHVYTEDDGGSAWWDVARDRGIVDAVVFRRDGRFTVQTVGRAEAQKDDDGNEYYVGYATSPDGFGTTSADTSDTPALHSEPTDTVGDGTQVPPQPSV